MSILEKLISAYEKNEDISIDEILSSTLKSYPGYAELSKEEVVELKRQFFDYCKDEEKAYFQEERVERIGKEAAFYEEAKETDERDLDFEAGVGARPSMVLSAKRPEDLVH